MSQSVQSAAARSLLSLSSPVEGLRPSLGLLSVRPRSPDSYGRMTKQATITMLRDLSAVYCHFYEDSGVYCHVYKDSGVYFHVYKNHWEI